MSQIKEFYAGKNIFITGGTGFLGKILIEKLLRSCPDIGTIYMLIRSKKGKSVQERIEALTAEPAFDVLRKANPDFAKKIVGINGDIVDEGLGLSAIDRACIMDEISVIFHLAANVRFDERLEVALSTNVNSVKSVIDIAKACKNLKATIYVSTAYSHCVRKLIDEVLHPTPLTYEEANEFIEDVKKNKWSEEKINDFTKNVVGEWPNTYSFSKAVAESTVAKFAKDIPASIVRPSMVTSSWNEPVPGWIDSWLNVHGAMVGIAMGVIHTLQMDYEATVDLVPVDMVCNAIIASGWKTAVTERGSSEDIPIYNYVTGAENPVSWRRFLTTCRDYSHTRPLSGALHYNSFIITKSRLLYVILDFFLHLVPALLIDVISRIVGKEPKFYRLYQKMSKSFSHVIYFCIREFNFRNQRVQNLWNGMNDEDKKIFSFSVRNLEWNKLFQRQVEGLRKYLLKEDEAAADQAKRRYLKLYIIHTIVRIAFVLFVLYAIWKIFCGCSLVISTQSIGL